MSQLPSGSDLGFEASLFKAADKLRGNMEPSDYKHVALGLIFLKHISDSFELKRRELLADYPDGAEDPDEYLAENVFWVPPEARWSHLQDSAKLPGIGRLIDEAMLAIEKVNPSLKGVLPKDYGRPALNAVMLGELIDLISGIMLGENRDRAPTFWAEYMNTSSVSSLAVRANEAASFTPLGQWCRPWLKCWSPTKAGYMILAADRAACSCSQKSLLKPMAAGSATLRSMVRKATIPHGVCAR